ncbi:MAG TPA: transporter [Candidatus Nanoarchaeia archaeon]|nr:transporter [Candidatus Nanoarchaeia archaeon]
MNKIITVLLVTIGMTIIGVIGDTILKLAGSGTRYIDWKLFTIGFILYASTALGWFFVLKHMKLATVGAFYSVILILLLTFVGIFYFKETIDLYEMTGIGAAIISLMLLTRFA